uniref:Uncharacterized protein n=1 Tax=Rhizophagus irregularis (strain DAOM 181602 / DAOM 197198 / MUCL 43194) TaxID=747089 RepID=U9U1G4_RHIID
MLFDIIKRLRNHFVLEFVLFGGGFDDFIRSFISDMNRLEQSIRFINGAMSQRNVAP